MVNDAEKFKDEDAKQKDRISAKNGLESYCFNMKTTIDDEKMKDKISADDKKLISDKCDDAIKWLDANQLAEVEEFLKKQKDVETVCNPIIAKLLDAQVKCLRLLYIILMYKLKSRTSLDEEWRW